MTNADIHTSRRVFASIAASDRPNQGTRSRAGRPRPREAARLRPRPGTWSRPSMTARCLVLASILLVIGLPAPAAAEPDELKALEDEIARSETALSTEGCAVACQAFGSMQRAADRLCALDPGP